MKTIELFSGTGSFSKVAKQKGFDIFRVELEKNFEAELHGDIFDIQRNDLPKHIDILWASPPCKTFSVASLRWYWKEGKPKNQKTWIGISMVLKTIQLIKEIQKDNPNLIWFIENPRGMLRKQDFMQEFPRKTITYCQYGDDRMKPTDIWTNLENWKPRPICKNGSPCHNSARRGEDKGTQGRGGGGKLGWINRAIIPPALFEEIFDVILKK